MTKLLIIGTGGHSRVIIEAAIESGIEIIGLIDLDYKNQKEAILNIEVLGALDTLNQFKNNEISVIIAVGDNYKRRELFHKVNTLGYSMINVIHPRAIISPSAKLGKGVFVNVGAVINSKAKIGNNIIINTGAIIEHEVEIADHSHMAPKVCVGGRTKIGENTFIGLGTNVANNILVGNNVTIGAGSTIIRDVNSNLKVVGVGRVLN